MDVYLDTIKLTKRLIATIKLTGDAKDYFNEEGIYSN